VKLTVRIFSHDFNLFIVAYFDYGPTNTLSMVEITSHYFNVIGRNPALTSLEWDVLIALLVAKIVELIIVKTMIKRQKNVLPELSIYQASRASIISDSVPTRFVAVPTTTNPSLSYSLLAGLVARTLRTMAGMDGFEALGGMSGWVGMDGLGVLVDRGELVCLAVSSRCVSSWVPSPLPL
jgi:hypothetical protein